MRNFEKIRKGGLTKLTHYQLELVKDKVCAAIADAVACSCEIKANYKSAFTNDLNALFERVDVAENVGDITRLVSQIIAKYREIGGDLACKILKEFLEKIKKDTLTSRDGIIYYKSEFRAKRK